MAARSTIKDPLDKFRFTVEWGQEPNQNSTLTGTSLTKIGFNTCQMPKRSTTKITYREGTDDNIRYNSAGLSTMEDIVLGRGLLPRSSSDEFYDWIKLVHDPSANLGESVLNGASGITRQSKDTNLNYRKSVIIKMYSRNGKAVRAWRVFNAFPTNFVPGSDLDAAGDDAKSIQTLTLTYDDFEELRLTSTVNGGVTLDTRTDLQGIQLGGI